MNVSWRKDCKIWYAMVFLVFIAISAVLCALGGVTPAENTDDDDDVHVTTIRWGYLGPGIACGVVGFGFLIPWTIAQLSQKCRKAKWQYTQGNI